ncbi:MAG: hypothetical protein QXL01_02855 [Thermoplasmatales archaeon]
MALDSRIKELLNKFADSQPALRFPGEPLGSSNPMLGSVIKEVSDTATSALANAATAQSTAENAENQAYTAGTPADWAVSAPTTLKAAIDRIASALAAEIGVPIP